MNHVISVLNTNQRDEMVKKLLSNYKIKASTVPSIEVLKDRINRISIYDSKKLIHTITVVVIPVIINIEALKQLRGDTTKFSFGVLFDELDRIKRVLKDMVDNPIPPKSELTMESIIDKVTTHEI